MVLLNKNKGLTYNNPEEIKYPINFSSELNKTSLKNINRKNINNVNNIFKAGVLDILNMSFILNKLISEQKFYEIANMLSEYKYDDILKILEIIIKIDKCNSEISLLNNKTKKKISL